MSFLPVTFVALLTTPAFFILGINTVAFVALLTAPTFFILVSTSYPANYQPAH